MSPRFESPPASASANPDRNSYLQPRPRPTKSAAELAEVRVKNRRRAYLDRHPGYFESSEHEFANPLLYDSLIRRFQHPEEMKEEAQKRGFARVLEGSLMRGEERLSKLASEDTQGGGSLLPTIGAHEPQVDNGAGQRSSSSALFGDIPAFRRGGFVWNQRSNATGNRHCQRAQIMTSAPTPVEADILGAPPVTTKEEGIEMWETFLRERFVRGGDEDFEYAAADEDDEYDVIERRDQEESWYDDEQPEWASDDGDSPQSGDGENGRRKVERVLEGETGIQDY